MIRFDTLAFVQRLTAAGFAREQAEAIVEGLAGVDTSGLAKIDLAETKAELKADLAGTKAEPKADLATLKADLQAEIGRVELKLGEFKTDLFRHMLVQTCIIVGAVIPADEAHSVGGHAAASRRRGAAGRRLSPAAPR